MTHLDLASIHLQLLKSHSFETTMLCMHVNQSEAPSFKQNFFQAIRCYMAAQASALDYFIVTCMEESKILYNCTHTHTQYTHQRMT